MAVPTAENLVVSMAARTAGWKVERTAVGKAVLMVGQKAGCWAAPMAAHSAAGWAASKVDQSEGRLVEQSGATMVAQKAGHSVSRSVEH